MKKILVLIAMATAISAHAAGHGQSGTSGGQTAYGHNGGAAYGGHAAAAASAGHSSAGAAYGGASAGSGQSGNASGLSYFSPYMDGDAVDPYQPWPEAEMRQFQKP